MRHATAKRFSSWAPATAIAMYCLSPSSQAHAVEWGGLYKDSNHRTANTIAVLSGTLPRTASITQTVPPQGSNVDSPWRQPLDELKHDLHATVTQLARALGVRRQSFYAWQRGDKAPSADSQGRISQLQVAADFLKENLGVRLPLYLNYPLGEAGESFWDLVATQKTAIVAASILVEAAEASTKRRRALDTALAGFLAEPKDVEG